MDEPTSENLGPAAAMQIRSVPERVREFYNDLARAEKCSLGELLTKLATGATAIATTVDGLPTGTVSAVATLVPTVPLDTLARALDATCKYAEVRGRDLSGRSTAAVAANKAVRLIKRHLDVAEAAAGTGRQHTLPSPEQRQDLC